MTTCMHCGHRWELLEAHIMKRVKVAAGCMLTVVCPKCGKASDHLRPDVGECNGD